MAPNHQINRPKGRNLRPLWALLPFIRPYLGTLFLAMGALLVASSAFLLTPIAVRYVIDFGFTSEDAASIDRYFFYLLGVVVLLGLFGAARAYFLTWLGERVVADIREAVFCQAGNMAEKENGAVPPPDTAPSLYLNYI